MSLKTSFCNKGLIKSDIKRFWWISIIHTILLFLFSGFLFAEGVYSGYVTIPNYDIHVTDSDIYSYSMAFWVMALIVPVILGVFLFSYLHSGKMSAFTHSIPVLRRTQFVSHVISGLILSLAPIVINGIILLLMRIDSEFADTYTVSHLLAIMGGSAVYTLVAFAFSVAVSMFMAHSLAALIFTYVFAILPLVVEAFIRFFLDTHLHGFANVDDLVISQKIYFSSSDMMNIGHSLIYLLLGVVLLGLAYLLYSKRKLENNSEIVAFHGLRPVFVYGAGICCGCVGYSFFNATSGVTSALALIPFGILGIVIATMIVKKSFRVFRNVYKPLIIYCAVVVALFAVTEYDLTGYESRVPDAEDVESVIFELPAQRYRNNYYEYDTEYNRIYYKDDYVPTVTDKADIEKIMDLHKVLISESESEDWYTYLSITYNLKNGRKQVREYAVDYDYYEKELEPVLGIESIRLSYYTILRDEDREIVSFEFAGYYGLKTPKYSYDTEQKPVVITDKESVDELTDALMKDLKTASHPEFIDNNTIMFCLRVFYKSPAVYADGTPVPSWKNATRTDLYYITDTYENVLAFEAEHITNE